MALDSKLSSSQIIVFRHKLIRLGRKYCTRTSIAGVKLQYTIGRKAGTDIIFGKDGEDQEKGRERCREELHLAKHGNQEVTGHPR